MKKSVQWFGESAFRADMESQMLAPIEFFPVCANMNNLTLAQIPTAF
jgi:hypothetical protein